MLDIICSGALRIPPSYVVPSPSVTEGAVPFPRLSLPGLFGWQAVPPIDVFGQLRAWQDPIRTLRDPPGSGGTVG